jgi:hypothetical protein
MDIRVYVLDRHNTILKYCLRLKYCQYQSSAGQVLLPIAGSWWIGYYQAILSVLSKSNRSGKSSLSCKSLSDPFSLCRFPGAGPLVRKETLLVVVQNELILFPKRSVFLYSEIVVPRPETGARGQNHPENCALNHIKTQRKTRSNNVSMSHMQL